jgi:hypothetical protein
MKIPELSTTTFKLSTSTIGLHYCTQQTETVIPAGLELHCRMPYYFLFKILDLEKSLIDQKTENNLRTQFFDVGYEKEKMYI